jgi:1,4-dihydroxy-6-naphthoate synthase
MGEAYGPIVVSKQQLNAADLRGKTIAVPGLLTTAYLVFKIWQPDFRPVVVPFDKILDAVQEGNVDAGLLIHEGQLTFPEQGLHLALDLGKWWDSQYHLPLPLGGNAIRRDWPVELRQQVAQLLRESVQYALDHRADAMAYALGFARDMQPELADRFVGMYVNEYTLDYGARGRQAIDLLFRLGHERGLIPRVPTIEF